MIRDLGRTKPSAMKENSKSGNIRIVALDASMYLASRLRSMFGKERVTVFSSSLLSAYLDMLNSIIE